MEALVDSRKLLFFLLGPFLVSPIVSGQDQEPRRLPTSKTILKPAPGAPQRTNGFPETIALSPDGRYAALLNNGYGSVESGMKQSIAIVDLQTNQVTDFPEDRLGEDAHQSYFVGLAFSSDGAHLYASMGSISDPTGEHAGNSGNGIAVYRFDQGKVLSDRFIKIPLQPVPAGVHVAGGLGKLPAGRSIPYPAGLAVIPDAGTHQDRLLVANNLSDNVVLLDAESGKELAHFALGTRRSIPSSFPYTVITTRDGKRAWCSLWNASQVVELDLTRKIIVRRIPLLVPKSHVAPGSHPTAMLLSPDEQILYVALSNADSVAAINARTGTVQAFFSTRLPKQEFAGNETDSLAQSKDGKRLFAANAAANSVAVFDTAGITQKRQNPSTPITALGFLPTEWYTLAVAVAGNDLLIATGKGLGTGPNGDEKSKEELSKHKKDYPYIPTLLHGSIARLSLDEVEQNLPGSHASLNNRCSWWLIPQRFPLQRARIPFTT